MLDNSAIHESEIVVDLRQMNDEITRLARDAVSRTIAGAALPEAYHLAYQALSGQVSAVEGMGSLREALLADDIDETAIAAIEGLYLKVLVGA